VPHLRDGFIVDEVGIAQSATAFSANGASYTSMGRSPM
jgi:hypothetical protein